MSAADEPDYATVADLAAAGVTARQVHHWCHRGYLQPTTADGRTGSGCPLLFSPGQADRARRMAVLVALGMDPHGAHRVASSALPVEMRTLVELLGRLGGGPAPSQRDRRRR